MTKIEGSNTLLFFYELKQIVEIYFYAKTGFNFWYENIENVKFQSQILQICFHKRLIKK